jgi:hypothetical protein
VPSGTFEKTNLNWQLQQLQQRIGEWLERLLANQPNLPAGENWQIPAEWLRGLLALIIGGIVGFLGWQLYQRLRPYWGEIGQWGRRSIDQKPNPTETCTSAEWVKRSQAAHRQGNYREACRALYMAMLQRLNEQNLIGQEASRTDGEYFTLAQALDRPQLYQLIIRTHERLCFSEAPISAEVFDRCWQAYQAIDQPGQKVASL